MANYKRVGNVSIDLDRLKPTAKPPVPTATATIPRPPMSSTTRPRPTVPTSSVPMPPGAGEPRFHASNSHQDFINRPGNTFGGVEGYQQSQQQRYNQAIQSGDQGLVQRLENDASRVGYTLTRPSNNTQTTPSAVPRPPSSNIQQTAGNNFIDLNRLPANNVPKPPTQPQTNTAATPATAQQQHQAYINRPGNTFGGVTGYQQSQQERYNQAILTGDQDLAQRLRDDAARVGFTLTEPQMPNTNQSTVPTPTTTTNKQPVTDPGAFTPTPSTTVPIPTPAQSIPSLNMNQIGQYADSQIDAELARQRSAADQAINAGQLTTEQQLAALRQSAERLRGDITEQRNLENVQNARRLNPFNGRTPFDIAMIERGRSREDERLNENQQMQEANAIANLAQLKNEIHAKYTALQQTSGAERERLIQSLRDSERQYSLQEAQLAINRGLANSQINNTDFNQDLSAWQANRGAFEFDKNFGLQEGQLLGNYQGQRTLAGQQFDEGVREYDQNFGYQQQRDERGDFVSDRDFNEQVRQFGVDTALRQAGLEQDARQYAASQGLQWEQLNQHQKEFAADQVWKQKNFDLEQSQLNQPETETLSPNELSTYVGLIQNIPSVNAQINYIESLNLAQSDKDQLYGLLGIQKAGPPAPSGGSAMTDSEILQYLK